MVGNRKFFLNNPGDYRAGPDAGMESIGHRTTVQNIRQSPQLQIGEFFGAARGVPLQNPVQAPSLPVVQADGDFGSMYFKEAGNLGAVRPFILSTTACSLRATR